MDEPRHQGSPHEFAKNHSLLVLVGLYLLLAVTAACFWPALSGPFVFDDFLNLEILGQVDGKLTRESIGRYLYQFNGSPGRPLAALSFLIEDNAWPATPLDFKRDNLLLHLLVGLLVFALARQLARLLGATPGKAGGIALACTAMWLLQPMQLPATMLVVQRMNILAALFVLLGLVIYVKVLCSRRSTEYRRILTAGVALGGFAVLAILCKENGVLIFAYAAALNLTLLRGRLGDYAVGPRRLLLFGVTAPLLMLLLPALVRPQLIVGAYEWRDFTFGERLLTQPRILFDYLSMILLPRLGGQGVFHDGYAISRSLWDPPATVFALVALVAFAISALALRRRFPLFAFAVLWFIAGHMLESSVIALELYFIHRNYLPMIGPLLAGAYGILQVEGQRRKLATAMLTAWIASAALLTYFNAGIWGDRGRLALTWLAENPGSVRAVQMAASYYADEGSLREAGRVLDEGYARMPRRAELGFQRVLLDCVDRGVAPNDWSKLLTLAESANSSRTVPEVIRTLRRNILASGCHGSLAIIDLRALISVLQRNPRYATNSYYSSALHYELAQMALAERDLNGLIENLDRSYAHRPDPMVAREAAIHLLNAGLPEDALELLDRSDATPMPWIKRRLLDIEAYNAPLRKAALEMRRSRR